MNRSTRTRPTTPLARSALHVTITDLVAEYELRHVFRNDTARSIEAVYSFPVPLDSAFMGMEATLAGEQRFAQVLPRQQASRKYDDAVADGDSAVLLERLEPGMLCVNLGNLKPGEEGEIVLRFAAALFTADGSARFSLPLVHRPRYGRSLLDELHEPRHEFAVEHPLEATIRVTGLLARSPVNCATHGARFETDGAGQCLRLNQAMLDRDLVLVFDLPADFSAQGRLVADGDAAIGVLTFTTPNRLRVAGPCDLCLVLDGSGSMNGDAIAQSRDALRAVAQVLQDEDRIQVVRFGSQIVPLFRRPLKASPRVRDAMVSLADTINADLGGTEMGKALDRSIDALSVLGQASGRTQAIILVTDGAVQPREVERVQARAVVAGIRIFIVAVGSSAGVDVLGPLAASTSAVLERAVPAEPIDEAVMRQLRRAREAGPLPVHIDWGGDQVRPLPLGMTYPGDAVTAIAMLPSGRSPRPRIRLASDLEIPGMLLDGPENVPALRALAGHTAWLHAGTDERSRLALHFGLITDETSAVLVKVRTEADKADGMPTVFPVAHMVPEGMVLQHYLKPAAMMGAAYRAPSADVDLCFYMDIPRFQRTCAEAAAPAAPRRPARKSLSPGRVAQIRQVLRAALDALLLADRPGEPGIEGLWDLIDPALHDDIHQYLAESSIELCTVEDACRLLEELSEEGVGAGLTDDQEAHLAVRRQEAE